MKNSPSINTCKSCGMKGQGNFCSNCGQAFQIKKISVKSILLDVIHLFTHLDKGFLYTLKQLIIAPGKMQRSYIQGRRSVHQKPFSLFFICVTITALIRYWIFNLLVKYYHIPIMPEATFFHEYMVITYSALLPAYALLTYLFFYKSGFNYGEVAVMMLYSVSILFLASILVSLLKLFFLTLDTALIEFPLFTVYLILTLIHFYKNVPVWKVILKAVLIMFGCFVINHFAERWVINLIS